MSGPGGETAGQPHGGPTNLQLIARMLRLAWHYRWGCIRVLALTVMLLTLEITALGLMGLGVDYIAWQWTTGHYSDELARLEALGVEPTADLATAPADARPILGELEEAHIRDRLHPIDWPLGLRPPRHWNPLHVIALISAGIVVFELVRMVLTYLHHLTLAYLVNCQIVVDLRAKLYDKMQRLSFRFFDANVSGSLINRVTGDVQAVRMFIDQGVVQTITLLITLGVFLVFMLKIHVWLTLACLATTPIMWTLTVQFARVVKKAYRESRLLADDLILGLVENLQGVHVVKGFAREEEEIARFATKNGRLRDQRQWIFMRHAIFAPLVHILADVNMMVLIGFGGYLAIRGEVTVGMGLLVFYRALQRIQTQVANITNIANAIQQSLVGAERVFEVLDKPMEIQSKPNALRLGRAEGAVGFENVFFGYNHGDRVLGDIDLTVEPGQCVAILGATGSGKSTLLSLIPRFYDPQAGVVRVDGHDVRDLDLYDLRRNVGLVFQESFLFSNTVAANIAFGHPEATNEQIEKAARIAAAHEFIVDLKHGYNTVLAESGGDLSGGQRQRLAIARAVLLEPPILLLDDPTAAIDPETEDEILKAMDNAMRGRTTFVVAHRLSLLRRADLVIVLHKGKIVQAGTHAELMAQKGRYRWAADVQTADATSRRLLGVDDSVEGGVV